MGGQDDDLGAVIADLGAPITVMGDGELASQTDPVAFSRRHQCAVRYADGRIE